MNNINDILNELEIAVSSTMDLTELDVADTKEEIAKLRVFIKDRVDLNESATSKDDEDDDSMDEERDKEENEQLPEPVAGLDR